jgi:hypothetical protein
MDRIEFLKNEIREKEDGGRATKKDIEFLRRMQENIKKDLETEKQEIAKSA